MQVRFIGILIFLCSAGVAFSDEVYPPGTSREAILSVMVLEAEVGYDRTVRRITKPYSPKRLLRMVDSVLRPEQGQSDSRGQLTTTERLIAASEE